MMTSLAAGAVPATASAPPGSPCSSGPPLPAATTASGSQPIVPAADRDRIGDRRGLRQAHERLILERALAIDVQPHRVAADRDDEIRIEVAILVDERQLRDRERHRRHHGVGGRERAAGRTEPGLERAAALPDHEIRVAVAVEIAERERADRGDAARAGQRRWIEREAAAAVVAPQRERAAAAEHQIHVAIAVDIGGRERGDRAAADRPDVDERRALAPPQLGRRTIRRDHEVVIAVAVDVGRDQRDRMAGRRRRCIARGDRAALDIDDRRRAGRDRDDDRAALPLRAGDQRAARADRAADLHRRRREPAHARRHRERDVGREVDRGRRARDRHAAAIAAHPRERRIGRAGLDAQRLRQRRERAGQRVAAPELAAGQRAIRDPDAQRVDRARDRAVAVDLERDRVAAPGERARADHRDDETGAHGARMARVCTMVHPVPGGIRFGQYVLLRRIARGGMAEVFLAQQQGLEGFDRRVAVKRILPHLVDSPDFVKMFLGEAKLAAQLSHPNVVHIYDFGKVGGDYFIAMEYVEGVHAGQLWKLGEKGNPSGSPLSPTLVARIGADAAAALHYAHELRGSNGKPLGLVHRDVSPANLMVSFDGVVKLCDFGIAKAAALSDQLTNPGQVKGKYAYMSPEQTIAAPLDGRSDVFSLAIVLWELITGKTIVGRGDAVDAMRAIRDGKLEPLEVAAPDTPKALVDAIRWALETKRDRRATAADLAQALEAFIKSSPELATPMQLGAWLRARFTRDSTGQQSVVTPGAGTAGTAAAGGTLGAGGTSAVGSVFGNAPTPPSRPPPELIAASRIGPDESPDDLLDGAETVSLDPMVASARASRRTPVHGDEESTVKPGSLLAAQAQRAQARTPRDAIDPTSPLELSDLEDASEQSADHGQTIRDRPRRSQTPGAAGAVAIAPSAPLRFEVPSLARSPSSPAAAPNATTLHERAPSGGAVPLPRKRRDATSRVAPRTPRIAVSIGALLAIGIASFLIALAARSGSHGAAPPPDATAAVIARDASALSVMPMPVPDASPPQPDASAAIADASTPELEAGSGSDAVAAAEPAGILDVTTTPSNATIRVGDQSRAAPAKLALPVGHYIVIAELHGYAPERREVDIERNEHVAQEILFTHRLTAQHATDRVAPVSTFGRLTVKTTPYSEVFTSAGVSLGQTPLADVQLPAGSHVLTFKNPDHADVTRRVTISAGKITKLQFNLP